MTTKRLCSLSLIHDATSIFSSAVDAVLPHQMVRRALVVDDGMLLVQQRSYALNHNIHMVGFGKAVIGMARAVEDLIGQHLVQGIISVPSGIQDSLRSSGHLELTLKPGSKVKVIEGAMHNVPDVSAEQAAKEIAHIVDCVGKDDVLIVLVSGGGSALLPSPLPSISLDEKIQAIQILSSKGATIQELNNVRKKLSKLKGGGLALLANPAKVVSLILSDVIGDRIDLIASGPTVQDTSSSDDALGIILRHGVESLMPHAVMKSLKDSMKRQTREQFTNVQNVIIGSNIIAVQRGLERAEELGYQSMIVSTTIHGEASKLGELYSQLCRLVGFLLVDSQPSIDNIDVHELVNRIVEFGVCDTFYDQLKECVKAAKVLQKPVCLLAGGETTVTIRGTGQGGRNQELALASAIEWHKLMHPKIPVDKYKPSCQMMLLSAGTDGQDGPTDAAGAFSHPTQVSEATKQNLQSEEFLENNNSYLFYSVLADGMYLLKTGLTGTNVMDLIILLIKPSLDS